jgi:hypothetical protein
LGLVERHGTEFAKRQTELRNHPCGQIFGPLQSLTGITIMLRPVAGWMFQQRTFFKYVTTLKNQPSGSLQQRVVIARFQCRQSQIMQIMLSDELASAPKQ